MNTSAESTQPVRFFSSSPTQKEAPLKAPSWQASDVMALFDLPFNDLIFRAQTVHRTSFPEQDIELATLLSIKTGGCEEDCGYCAQSARYDTNVKAQKILGLEEVLENAQAAKNQGSRRFCMGAAWRGLKDRDLDKMVAMVKGVKALGLETCMTLGILTDEQAKALKEAGLDYYNHNLDTAQERYGEIVSTHTYEDRLATLTRVREAGMKVCCGGILGMGESRKERAALITQLANLDPYPESVPINHLVPIAGTPLGHHVALDPLECVRTIAVARITMPHARVRLSAGRREMGEAIQILCFLAGANSIFYGDKLLTTGNPEHEEDLALLKKLGLKTQITSVDR